MSAQITVNDFKWIKGENDQEYIRLLLDALERQKEITAKAVAKVKELSEQNSPSQMPGASDLISRQRVFDLFDAWEAADLGHHIPKILRDRLKTMPSVQPEQRWIPCKTRLPDDRTRTDVLITVKNVGRKPKVISTSCYGGWFTDNNGGWWKSTDKEVLAWMKTPKPYGGDQDE